MNNTIGVWSVVLLLTLFVSSTSALGADKQQFCNTYADKAVTQYNLAKQHNLPGIVPPVWSNDRNGHFNWCMHVPENVANSENAKRQAYLDKYLPQNTTEKGMVIGTVTGAIGNNGGGSVAATPISIPRPVKVGKIQAKDLGTIEISDFIAMDNNIMHIRLYYKVDPSVADGLYAGAFLYDANLKAIDAGYKPTREYRSPEGSIDVYLVLPSKPFESATMEAFLIHSGKVIVKQYFKAPLRWDGHHVSLNSNIDGKLKSTGGWGKTDDLVKHKAPIGPDPGGWGKHEVPIGLGDGWGKHVAPIGFDPGLGP